MPANFRFGRELDGVAGREVEPGDPLARADLHGREEPREVVLDPGQVHLVQDHVELPRGAAREVGRGPLAGGLLYELAEGGVVVEAVERGEVAQQIFVRRPARVDGHELGPGPDRIA